MIDHATLFVCSDARSERWRTALVAELDPCLFGWRISALDDRDASVPGPVRAVFARALCSHGAVSFPSSESGALAAHVIERHTSVIDRIRACLTGRSCDVSLVSTEDASVVERAFDDPGFPWWMQGQVLVVTDRGVVPELTLSRTLELVEPQAPIAASLLESLRIRALLRPGVDGAVAALSCTSSSIRSQLLASIEHAAKAAGLHCRAVDEPGLMESLATGWLGSTPYGKKPKDLGV